VPAVSVTLPLVSVALVLLLRFKDVKRWIAWTGNKGAGRRIFRFRGKRLTAVPYADRFFFN
jgi:hypothetical protein